MSSSDTRPVVVGTDGGPGSAGALRFAAVEAARRGAPVQVVHVLPSYPPPWPAMPSTVTDPELREVASAIADQAADTVRALSPGVVVSTHLAVGSRSAGLVEASHDAQLVVVGRETRRGLDRVLTGTTTAAVAARATCEVAVVPSFWTGDHVAGRVVAGVAWHKGAHEMLAEAFAEAAERHASLTLVTAWQLPDPYLDRIEVRSHAAEWETDGRRMMEERAEEWRHKFPDVQVDVRIEHGRAAEVLLACSRGCDLLVLSRRRHAVPAFAHLGGASHAVLLASEIPVLVVPTTGATPEQDEGLRLEESGAPLK